MCGKAKRKMIIVDNDSFLSEVVMFMSGKKKMTCERYNWFKMACGYGYGMASYPRCVAGKIEDEGEKQQDCWDWNFVDGHRIG